MVRIEVQLNDKVVFEIMGPWDPNTEGLASAAADYVRSTISDYVRQNETRRPPDQPGIVKVFINFI